MSLYVKLGPFSEMMKGPPETYHNFLDFSFGTLCVFGNTLISLEFWYVPHIVVSFGFGSADHFHVQFSH